jgi:hypothetical protein
VPLLGGEKKIQGVMTLGETSELDYSGSVFVRIKGEVDFKKDMSRFGKTIHYTLDKTGETVSGTVT